MRIEPYRPNLWAVCCFLAVDSTPYCAFGLAPIRGAFTVAKRSNNLVDPLFASSNRVPPPEDFTIEDDDEVDSDSTQKLRDTTKGETPNSAQRRFAIPTSRSSRTLRPPKVQVVKPRDESDDEQDSDDDDSDNDSDNNKADWKSRVPKRSKQSSMLGTNWMQKNQRFDPDMSPTPRSSRNEEEQKLDKNFRQDFRGTRVFVQGIPLSASWQDLKDHFKVAGSVVFASVSTDPMTGMSKGHGIVQFESTDMAKNAIKIMRDHPLDGAALYVREDVQEGKNGASLKSVSPGGGDGPTPPSTWKCADEAQLEYLAEHEYKGIRSLIKARDSARRRKNFDASDDMRDQLKKSYGVHLDDRLKMWWISWDGKEVPDNVASVKGDGRWGGLQAWRQIPTTRENDACVDPDLVNGLLKKRDIARKEKDFLTADALLEEARQAPGNDLQLRIHDESRTWRIWTESPPPRSMNEIYGEDQNDEYAPVLSAAEQCIAIVQANAPNKVAEVTKLLEQFPGREYNILKKIKQQYS